MIVLSIDSSFRVIPLYINYLTFKNDLKGRAINTSHPSIETLRKDILEKAAELDIPLKEEGLFVEMDDKETHIKISYSIEVKFLGGYYPRKFNFRTESTRANLSS